MEDKWRVRGEGNTYRILVGEPEGKRSLGRPRHRWEDKFKVGFKRNMGGCGPYSSGSGWQQVAASYKR
jgi:hypothetical protein